MKAKRLLISICACLTVSTVMTHAPSKTCQIQSEKMKIEKSKRFVTSAGDSVRITPLGWKLLEEHKLKETVDKIFEKNKNANDAEIIMALLDSVSVDSLQKIVLENKEGVKKLKASALVGLCLYYYDRLKYEHAEKDIKLEP